MRSGYVNNSKTAGLRLQAIYHGYNTRKIYVGNRVDKAMIAEGTRKCMLLQLEKEYIYDRINSGFDFDPCFAV